MLTFGKKCSRLGISVCFRLAEDNCYFSLIQTIFLMGRDIMTKTSSFILAAAIAAAGGTAAAGERVGDFALIDHKGAFQSMAWHDDSAAIAILPQAVGATDTFV